MGFEKISSLKTGDLEIKEPIIQGGMGVGISLSELASAVAYEGGVIHKDESGKPVRKLGTHLDATQQKLAGEQKEVLEQRLIQTQKLESIGTLSGGIAHDFNNILSAILGYAELLEYEIGERPELNVILESSKRATNLVKQLLAFSRKEDMKKEHFNLNKSIDQVVTMLKLKKNIEIKKEFGTASPVIDGDPSQIECVLLNLGINASHAMPKGGTLIYSTSKIDIDEEFCKTHSDLVPGPYIKLEVSDTGHGIPSEIIPYIFEPYFTTKKKDEGTGLGLSASYGYIKSHKGSISVYSKKLEGTKFVIYLPTLKIKIEEKIKPNIYYGNGEKIFVVDDEETNRDLGKLFLESLKYDVILRENGLSAVKYYKKHMSEIDLIILDVEMPVMSGDEAYRLIRDINPDVKVIIATGLVDERLEDFNGIEIMQKPFTLNELSKKVHNCLNK